MYLRCNHTSYVCSEIAVCIIEKWKIAMFVTVFNVVLSGIREIALVVLVFSEIEFVFGEIK